MPISKEGSPENNFFVPIRTKKSNTSASQPPQFVKPLAQKGTVEGLCAKESVTDFNPKGNAFKRHELYHPIEYNSDRKPSAKSVLLLASLGCVALCFALYAIKPDLVRPIFSKIKDVTSKYCAKAIGMCLSASKPL